MSVVLVRRPQRRTNILFAHLPQDILALAQWSNSQQTSILLKLADKKILCVVNAIGRLSLTVRVQAELDLHENVDIATLSTQTELREISLAEIISAKPFRVNQ